MQSVHAITAKLINGTNKQTESVQSAISGLQAFDVRLLTSEHLKVRQLATAHFFKLLSDPRIAEKSLASSPKANPPQKKPLARIYLPVIRMGDVFYLCCNEDQRGRLEAFHSSLLDLLKVSNGFLDNKILAAVAINTSDGLISSFGQEPLEQLSAKLCEMGDPLQSRVFCTGANFWATQADIQYCRIGGGEEEVPSISDSSFSGSSIKSMQDIEITNPQKTKSKSKSRAHFNLVINRSVKDLSQSLASLALLSTAVNSASKATDVQGCGSHIAFHPKKSGSRVFKTKEYLKSSFARESSNSNKNIQLSTSPDQSRLHSLNHTKLDKRVVTTLPVIHKKKNSESIDKFEALWQSPYCPKRNYMGESLYYTKKRFFVTKPKRIEL